MIDITVNKLRNVLTLITTLTLCSLCSNFEGYTGLTKYGLITSGCETDSEYERERLEYEFEAYLRSIGEVL